MSKYRPPLDRQPTPAEMAKARFIIQFAEMMDKPFYIPEWWASATRARTLRLASIKRHVQLGLDAGIVASEEDVRMARRIMDDLDRKMRDNIRCTGA